MRSRFFFLFLAGCAIPVLAQASLILIRDTSADCSAVTVIEKVENTYIALADKSQLARLKARNVACELLDKNTRGKDYFLVYPFGSNPSDKIRFDARVFENYGRVLAEYPSCLLMQSTDTTLGSITEYNIELNYIEQEPMSLIPPPNTIVDTMPKPAPKNPLLEEMLNKVDKDSVDAFERKLCSFHNRDIMGKYNKTEVMPYLKQKFLEYGCDSIIELPIKGGTDNTTVAGVRFGQKDRTIKKFCLIGGHPDSRMLGSGSATARHQGANDNATGTVGVLEAARVHRHYDFDYTIIYAGFNGEEYGSYGADALVKSLMNAGAKVIGGGFNYDMLGLWGSTFTMEVYNAITGAKEFVDRINELATAYKTYPFTIKTTSNGSQPTDVTNFWQNGYACVWHMWGNPDDGGIHSPKDSLDSRYKVEHMTGALKIGLLVTAFYAVPHKKTAVTKQHSGGHVPSLTCRRTAAGAVQIAIGPAKKASPGVLEIFDLHGRTVRRFAVTPSGTGTTTLVWDGTNAGGAAAGSGSLFIIRYREATSGAIARVMTGNLFRAGGL